MKTILGTTKLRINDPGQQLFIYISVHANLVFVGSIVDWINTIRYSFVDEYETKVYDNIMEELQRANLEITYTIISKMEDEIASEIGIKELQFTRIKEEINTQERLNPILPHEEQNLQRNKLKANEVLYELGILKTAIQRVKHY
jgi:hypothetical protein